MLDSGGDFISSIFDFRCVENNSLRKIRAQVVHDSVRTI